MSFSPTTVSVEVGKTAQLNAVVAPNNATEKTVTYKVADTTVATVDASGKVTAVKAGSTKVTGTTQDGSKTSDVTITVTDPVAG